MRERQALLLDAGSGLGRLVAPELQPFLRGAERCEIVLTHFHLDHLVGLAALHRLAQGKPIKIHAPGPPFVAGDPDCLAAMIRPPFFPVALASWPHPVEVVPLVGPSFFAGGFHLRVRRQPHPGGSVGVRIEDLLAYLTDTAKDPEHVQFVRGVQLLLIEAWALEAESSPLELEQLERSGHLSAREAGRIAQAAGIPEVALIHHPPWADRVTLERFVAEAQEETTARILLLEEGSPLPLKG